MRNKNKDDEKIKNMLINNVKKKVNLIDWNYFSHYCRHKRKEEFLGEKLDKEIIKDMMLMMMNNKYEFLKINLDFEQELKNWLFILLIKIYKMKKEKVIKGKKTTLVKFNDSIFNSLIYYDN